MCFGTTFVIIYEKTDMYLFDHLIKLIHKAFESKQDEYGEIGESIGQSMRHHWTRYKIDQLTVQPFDPNNTLSQSCGMCTEPFQSNDPIILLPCSHAFHHYPDESSNCPCIQDWWTAIDIVQCPVCRLAL